MNRILIVDGSNLLFQMFFGMPARIVNKQGKTIQGTLGFVGALLKIIRMVKPTHTVVFFDGEHENSRAVLDEEYKANRVDYSLVSEEENPFSQLPDVYDALDFLHIRYAETADCETDDWVAGYAIKYGKENQIVISSFDSDFFQLITENVSVLRYRGEKTVIWTPDVIREKLSVKPEQYADYKALTGDSADNIKGAEKVGPKTAAALIREFGSLEDVLYNAESIQKPSVKESVIRNTERLKRNYQLIKLKGCDALPFSLDELIYSDSGIKTNDVLIGIGIK